MTPPFTTILKRPALTDPIVSIPRPFHPMGCHNCPEPAHQRQLKDGKRGARAYEKKTIRSICRPLCCGRATTLCSSSKCIRERPTSKKKSHVFGTRLYCLFMFIVWLAKHTSTWIKPHGERSQKDEAMIITFLPCACPSQTETPRLQSHRNVEKIRP